MEYRQAMVRYVGPAGNGQGSEFGLRSRQHVLSKGVFVQTENLERLRHADSYSMVEHQFRELLPVDEDYG